MWRFEHPHTNCEPRVERRLSNVACIYISLYIILAALCHVMQPVTCTYIFRCIAASKRYTLDRAGPIYISGYRSANRGPFVIARCMLGSLDENRTENLRFYSLIFATRRSKRLSEWSSLRKLLSCIRAMTGHGIHFGRDASLYGHQSQLFKRLWVRLPLSTGSFHPDLILGL